MEYRVYGQDVVVRMDRGEEILDCIRQVCEKEHILLGSVSGIGAIGEVTLGVFNREKFIYEKRDYTGDMEIASCSGNISTMKGKNYLHIHMVVGNEPGCHQPDRGIRDPQDRGRGRPRLFV